MPFFLRHSLAMSPAWCWHGAIRWDIPIGVVQCLFRSFSWTLDVLPARCLHVFVFAGMLIYVDCFVACFQVIPLHVFFVELLKLSDMITFSPGFLSGSNDHILCLKNLFPYGPNDHFEQFCFLHNTYCILILYHVCVCDVIYHVWSYIYIYMCIPPWIHH